MSSMNPERTNSHPSRLKSIAFFSYDDQDALATLRLLGPAKMAGWEILRGYDFDDGRVHVERVDPADLVFIQRDFCRDYDTYNKILDLLERQKKPFLIDLDDNLFEIPADHPDRMIGYYVDALLPVYQAVMDADLITVATEPLREYLLPFNTNIKVIPNYLDDSVWKISPPVPRSDQKGKITIGYMGGNTHRPDVRMLVPVFLQLLEKYPGRIEYHFWGIEAPPEVEYHSRVDWYPLLFDRYDKFAAAFGEVEADIMVAPLCDNRFNACKSCIKFLEYNAAGLAGVYSRVTPYADVIEPGKDGLLASTTDEWVAEISKLIEIPSLRTQLVENAQIKIRREWLLSANLSKRTQIYEDLLSNFQPKERISTPSYKLQQSLSDQYYEEGVRRDKQFKSMKTQIVDKDDRISYLDQQVAMRDENIRQFEEEVLSYVMSRSWRITRPFRELARLIGRLIHA